MPPKKKQKVTEKDGGKKPYICHCCEAHLNDEPALVEHIQSVHLANLPFKLDGVGDGTTEFSDKMIRYNAILTNEIVRMNKEDQKRDESTETKDDDLDEVHKSSSSDSSSSSSEDESQDPEASLIEKTNDLKDCAEKSV